MSQGPVDDPVRLIRDLRNLVRLHRDFGILDYPKSPELESFLRPAPLPGPPSSQTTAKEAARATAPKSSPAATPEAVPTPAPDRQTLTEIAAELGDCARCPLSQSRDTLLFGAGPANARLLIVGDFPTRADEAANSPFGGEPGELLTRMLKAIGQEREAVYLTTTVKCRTNDGGPPQPDQIAACLPFLIRQIDAVAPKVICAMGPVATQALLKSKVPLVRLRGRFHEYRGIPLMPTFHPTFLIKNPDLKKAAWIDLQTIQAKLG